MHIIAFPESLSGLLSRQVPLGFCHQLKSHQELPNSRATQQRRIEMQMQVCNITLVLAAIGVGILRWGNRTLVNTHRVCERATEQVVVASRDLRQYLSERELLRGCEVVDRRYVSIVRK